MTSRVLRRLCVRQLAAPHRYAQRRHDSCHQPGPRGGHIRGGGLRHHGRPLRTRAATDGRASQTAHARPDGGIRPRVETRPTDHTPSLVNEKGSALCAPLLSTQAAGCTIYCKWLSKSLPYRTVDDHEGRPLPPHGHLEADSCTTLRQHTSPTRIAVWTTFAQAEWRVRSSRTTRRYRYE